MRIADLNKRSVIASGAKQSPVEISNDFLIAVTGALNGFDLADGITISP
jgi:hypothetical protein